MTSPEGPAEALPDRRRFPVSAAPPQEQAAAAPARLKKAGPTGWSEVAGSRRDSARELGFPTPEQVS